jgi:uncharacterized protein with HEPN domain
MTKKKDPKDLQKVGRKPLYTNPQDIIDKAEQYKIACEADNEQMTICGLARTLGFADRISLLDYRNKPEFTTAIKKAVNLVGESIEKLMLTGKNPGGPIFWWKNHGMTDRQEHNFQGIESLFNAAFKASHGKDKDIKEKLSKTNDK